MARKKNEEQKQVGKMSASEIKRKRKAAIEGILAMRELCGDIPLYVCNKKDACPHSDICEFYICLALTSTTRVPKE